MTNYLSASPYNTPPAVVGDMNGDGVADVVIINGNSLSTIHPSATRIYFSDGAGTYTAHTDPFPENWREVYFVTGSLNTYGVPSFETPPTPKCLVIGDVSRNTHVERTQA